MAARDDPNSADALAGMAACYDQMGRFDLSRRSYEAALALAPNDLEILGAFAGSLQLQGSADEALSVGREIAARAAASRPQAVAEASSLAPQTPPVIIGDRPGGRRSRRKLAGNGAGRRRSVNVAAPAAERLGVGIAKPETAASKWRSSAAPVLSLPHPWFRWHQHSNQLFRRPRLGRRQRSSCHPPGAFRKPPLPGRLPRGDSSESAGPRRASGPLSQFRRYQTCLLRYHPTPAPIPKPIVAEEREPQS